MFLPVVLPLDVIFGRATIRPDDWTSNRIELHRKDRPAPLPCRCCGATKREEHVTGWRCAYCGSDR